MKLILATLIALAALCVPAHARDGYGNDGRPVICNDKDFPGLKDRVQCRDWLAAVKRPDADSSCCGDGDAYIADAFIVRDGKYFAIITEDYPAIEQPDGEGGSYTIPAKPKGTEIEIPKNKFNNAHANGGNPSGHGIVFISWGSVICYFGPTLS